MGSSEGSPRGGQPKASRVPCNVCKRDTSESISRVSLRKKGLADLYRRYINIFDTSVGKELAKLAPLIEAEKWRQTKHQGLPCSNYSSHIQTEVNRQVANLMAVGNIVECQVPYYIM